MSWGGGAGKPPVATTKNALHIGPRALAQADIDERSHHDAHLVSQKAVAFELKVHLTAPGFMNGRGLQGTHG